MKSILVAVVKPTPGLVEVQVLADVAKASEPPD